MNNGRQVAVQALLRVEIADSYSNIVLDRLLESSRLSARDRAFSSALFYGVLEKKLTLDYVISQYSSLPFGKMDPLVRQLLRLAIYQIVYMDGVPESAAVNESVELAKKMGKGRAAGFINGVLRSFLRAGGEIRLPQPGKDRASWLSLAYSIPRPLIKLWQNQYPKEDAEALLRGMTGHAPLFVRVNTRLIFPTALCCTMQERWNTWKRFGRACFMCRIFPGRFARRRWAFGRGCGFWIVVLHRAGNPLRWRSGWRMPEN